MLGQRAIFWPTFWQGCESTYDNTLRANMPHCNMEPCAMQRSQSPVCGRLTPLVPPRPVAAAAMLSSPGEERG